jgi:hypothetical protein
MTDPKCTTTFILAGYEAKVRSQLFASNEGLERRFATVYTIARPTNDELALIFERLLKKGWKSTIKREDLAKVIAATPALSRFNGGDMEHLVACCEKAHIARYFPARMSRKISYGDLNVAVKSFLELKSRARADNVSSGMYI